MAAYYGDWIWVFVNVALFGIFVLAFTFPKKRADWFSYGVYKAFLIAFFTEMYGFPITIYFFSSVFAFRTGGWSPIIEILGMENFAPILARVGLGLALIGSSLVITGWWRIYSAKGELVRDGVYRYLRHPQYLGIMLIVSGILTWWPTLLTLMMWPITLFAYHRLAKREEIEMIEKFGKRYEVYKRRVPMFLPLIPVVLKRTLSAQVKREG